MNSFSQLGSGVFQGVAFQGVADVVESAAPASDGVLHPLVRVREPIAGVVLMALIAVPSSFSFLANDGESIAGGTYYYQVP
jgi:hypothetical protein